MAESEYSQDSQQSVSIISSNKSGPVVQKDKEKIQFAAGLCLLSKSDPQIPSDLTRIELTYLEKCRIMLTMFKKDTCCCHNQNYGSWKKLLGHLRQLYAWFTPYTCYNCLIVYNGRSGKMRHQMKCPRAEMEYLIRLSEIKTRPDDKVRLYQNFKCMECNLLYSFHEDYCAHVDEMHVAEEGPYACVCSTSFENADEFRQHIHKSCYLNYFCDICFLVTPSNEDFRQHCEEFHDQDDDFQFLSMHENFRSFSAMQIGKMLVENMDKHQRQVDRQERQEIQKVVQVKQVKYKPEKRISIMKTEPVSINGGTEDEDDESKVLNPLSIRTKSAACCLICNKVYSNYHIMLKHMKTAHEVDYVFNTSRNACDVCGNEFSNFHNMLRHRRIHEEDMKKIECPECPQKFRLNYELKEHLNTIHSTSRPVRATHRCKECTESFKNFEQLVLHQATHNYTCQECGKECENSADFEQHRNSHLNITLKRDPNTLNYRSDNSPDNMCQLCDKTFENLDELQAHVELHDTMPTLEMEEDEVNDSDSKDFKTYSCEDCDKIYSSSRGLWVHNKRYHPNRKTGNKEFPKPCDECGRVITTCPAYLMHKAMHRRMALKALNASKGLPPNANIKGNDDSDYHTCKRCFKVFASKYNLKTHMKSHGINVNASRGYAKAGKYQKTFWCDICHQACQGMAELNRHKQEHMNEESSEVDVKSDMVDIKPKRVFMFNADPVPNIRPVYCKYCKIPFNSVSSLSRHMDEEHDEQSLANVKNNTRFPCPICKKVFSSTGALSTHQGWHKRTKFNRTMVKTETNNVEVELVQRFKCITCGAFFDDDTSLQLHILEIHRNINATVLTIKCSACHQEFNSRAEYEVHVKLHHREAKAGVLCKYCNKVFSRGDYLNIHINKKHPEYATVGSYECSQCERVFEKQNALTIHLKVHERTNVAATSNGPAPPANTRVYKYSCSICHTGYDIPKELRNHIISNHPF